MTVNGDISAVELYQPKFHPSWSRYPLHGLATWINGMVFRNISFAPSGTAVVKIAEIKNGVSGQTKFTRERYDDKYFLSNGDMLFCWSGQPETSIDTYWWRGGDGWLNQHIFKVLPDTQLVDRDFFYQLLRYLRPIFVRIARNKQTTGLGHVTKADLQRLEVALPGREEQRSIATTLGALDNKIESNRRIVSLASKLIDATSEQAVRDLSTTPLSTLVNISKVSSNPAKLDVDLVDHYSLPAFDANALPERVSPGTIMSNKILVPRRAILLSRLNPRIERFWWASPENGIPALASTEFSPLISETDIGLAAAWLAVRSPAFREVLPMRVTGTSGSHQRVRPEDMLAIEVPDTRKLGKASLEQTLALLEYIEETRRQCAKLEALRDALLPELISGRIRVPVEVAS
ncbi:MAG: restriction endonuclease subunit S [Candidatus Nanopelagicales bacterium]